jgi:hypothetical protein
MSVVDIITSQVGGAQDPCTAGGAFCPQPQSFGASLNPCCWSSAASSNPIIDPNTGYATTDNPAGLPPTVTQIPSWVWLGGLGILGFILVKNSI